MNWIDSLPPKDAPASPPRSTAVETPKAPSANEETYVTGRAWDASHFRRRSQQLYGACSVRELYHYLVNVEFYPDILSIAERFAHDRLERSIGDTLDGRTADSHTAVTIP